MLIHLTSTGYYPPSNAVLITGTFSMYPVYPVVPLTLYMRPNNDVGGWSPQHSFIFPALPLRHAYAFQAVPMMVNTGMYYPPANNHYMAERASDKGAEENKKHIPTKTRKEDVIRDTKPPTGADQYSMKPDIEKNYKPEIKETVTPPSFSEKAPSPKEASKKKKKLAQHIWHDLLENIKSHNNHIVLSFLSRHEHELGGDLDKLVDAEGNTLLHLATKYGDVELVETFLDMGASPNVQSSVGYTPLHFACDNKTHKIAKCLLEHGADPQVFEEALEQTPLHVACQQNRPKLVEVFLQPCTSGSKSIDRDHLMNQFDVNGMTPLMHAARKGHSYSVKTLLEHGADPNIKAESGEYQGMDALDIARKKVLNPVTVRAIKQYMK